jgi:hypothetical protein
MWIHCGVRGSRLSRRRGAGVDDFSSVSRFSRAPRPRPRHQDRDVARRAVGPVIEGLISRPH